MKPVSPKILVIDDDPRLRELLVRYLSEQGFQVQALPDARELDKKLQRDPPHLLVLDLMLPGEDGLAVCRRLRASGETAPIIMLTAKGEDVDRIVGLELGADDYLPKPFNPRELVARIRAILRRTQSGEKSVDKLDDQIPAVVQVGDIELDPATRIVRQNGKPVELTSVEFNLLHVLLREAGRVVTREHLVDVVLSRKFSPFDRSIDMHVSKVRKKLGDSDNGSDHIKTVRGVGYIFAHPRDHAKAAPAKAEEA